MSETNNAPNTPKIYHIVHVDRLASIVSHQALLCDAETKDLLLPGTEIGMSEIKQRRANNELKCHPGLRVANCVPFYFCPRSVMLYVISKENNPQLAYRGGQDPIVHIEADLRETVSWANQYKLRWAFTLSNAGSMYFEDYCDLKHLTDIDWNAVHARNWIDCKHEKQAEFLIEKRFPWHLVQRIGVNTNESFARTSEAIASGTHKPKIKIMKEWYY